jgi:Tol biopolymer transport system component
VESEAAGVYAGGKVFFLHDGSLHARTLDLAAMSLREDDQVINGPVPLGSRSVAALAANGDRVVYRTGLEGGARQLTWYSRTGQNLGTVSAPFYAGAGAPSLSPDATQVVINYMIDGIGEIGIVDIASGRLTDVSNNPANDSYPIWAADGGDVLFSSKRTETYEMYRQAPDGRPLKVFGNVGLRHPMDMTRDSRLLIYRMNTPDLWVRDMIDGRETVLIPPGTTRPQWPQLSPDGRWVAFQSAASGRRQIHLYGPLVPPGQLGAMSPPLTVNGGGWVRWRGDGRELYYAEPDGTLMAIGLTFNADGTGFTAAAPERLFTAPMSSGPEDTGLAQQYMVTNDGQRFLVIAAPEARSPVHMLRVAP